VAEQEQAGLVGPVEVVEDEDERFAASDRRYGPIDGIV